MSENLSLPLVQRDIYTPTRLNQEARDCLERAFPLIWLEGEISNLSRPRSGHLYFSLKDENAQVRCAMFRGNNVYLSFKPADGQKVLVRAQVSLYQARGEFQLVVRHMEEAGAGALRRAFDALKARLETEGLFDPANKKPLPAVPRRIGVITSPTGAALRDVLTVLRRRYPVARVLVYPVPVQGAAAAPEIARTITLASGHGACDVLILCRGGGSLEDLWAFNEEPVARAVHACAIPIVAGVGHETDFTIAEFAADRRAPTPTAAAELVTPSRLELLERLAAVTSRLGHRMRDQLQQRAQRLDWTQERLLRLHPGRRLAEWRERLAEYRLRMRRATAALIAQRRDRLGALRARLRAGDPRRVQLPGLGQSLRNLEERLRTAQRARLQRVEQRLQSAMRQLNAVSPLATLERGYAIVVRASDGALVRSCLDTGPDQIIRARLSDGSLRCEVRAVEPGGRRTPPPDRDSGRK